MFGSENENNFFQIKLPANEHSQGVIADTKISNIEISLHYDDYPLDNISYAIKIIGNVKKQKQEVVPGQKKNLKKLSH